MAEIYGVKVTGLKTFIGMEGPAWQGNVRLNGKLLGFWSQDGNGGCDRYEFDIAPLREPARKLFDSMPETWKYRKLYEKEDGSIDDSYLDAFMYELCCLAADEKEWKQMSKKGYSIMVWYHHVPDPKYPNAVPVTKVIFFTEDSIGDPEESFADYLEKIMGEPVIIEKIASSPGDFIIK